ncbi:hypothetical protein [Campylobacter coli]
MTKDEVALELTKIVLEVFPLKKEDLKNSEDASRKIANLYRSIFRTINIR